MTPHFVVYTSRRSCSNVTTKKERNKKRATVQKHNVLCSFLPTAQYNVAEGSCSLTKQPTSTIERCDWTIPFEQIRKGETPDFTQVVCLYAVDRNLARPGFSSSAVKIRSTNKAYIPPTRECWETSDPRKVHLEKERCVITFGKFSISKPSKFLSEGSH